MADLISHVQNLNNTASSHVNVVQDVQKEAAH